MIEFDRDARNRVIVNWSLKPRYAMKELGIKAKLDKYADWQSLKRFDWGELAYDYEEGLKFGLRITEETVKKLTEFVRDFHTKRGIPLIIDGDCIVSSRFCMIGKGIENPVEILERNGWVQDSEFDFVYNYVG